ncbi:hypothetical protein OIV83_003369 [Microbotryomycetes sp. JL201]|nr:hypothetical protein OIV83_003369 [Microbotryomycetes sp. JL201]
MAHSGSHNPGSSRQALPDTFLASPNTRQGPRALPPGAAYAPQTLRASHTAYDAANAGHQIGTTHSQDFGSLNGQTRSDAGAVASEVPQRAGLPMQPSLSDSSSGPSTVRPTLPTPPSSRADSEQDLRTPRTNRNNSAPLPLKDDGRAVESDQALASSIGLARPVASRSALQPPPFVRRPTDVSQDGDYALPLQFSPIPAHMNSEQDQGDYGVQSRPGPSSRSASYPATPSAPSGSAMLTRTSIDRNSVSSLQRPSTIPSFVPAAAFSANDRGPYPPISPSSSKLDSVSYVGASIADQSTLGVARGNPRQGSGASESEMLVVAGPADTNSQDARRLPRILTDLPTSMVGVGRNSIVKSASNASPQQAFAGLVDPSPSSSPIQQQFAQQHTGHGPPQPSFVSPRTGSARLPSAQPPQPPPHLVPQPEICVECMMRDRDMADVDVLGEGVWDRDSDVEFEEAVKWEDEHGSSADHGRGTTGSEESGSGVHGALTSRSRRRSREGMSGGSRESVGGRSSMYGGPNARRRIGRGQLLTSANLKLWTSMNSPASSHRWRTLQTYLATQAHLLEMERHAREATAAEKERIRSAKAADVRLSAPTLASARSRSSTTLASGFVAGDEFGKEDRHSRVLTKNKSRQHGADEQQQRASILSLQPRVTNASQASIHGPSSHDMQSYSYGDQPWLSNATRRYSSSNGGPPTPGSAASSVKGYSFGKFARSSTDLRSTASPRSVSPARTSLGVEERRGSVWSKFRQSASQSVLSFAPSFAPSGSMMDMHLGLSMDHRGSYTLYDTYPSMSDPAVARHVEQERDKALANGERPALVPKSKKGIKGFFSKLVGGGSSSDKREKKITSVPAREPPFAAYDYFDSQDLAPPPPLSALANEPRNHGRSPSSSSVDSFGGPYTPPPPLHSRLSNNGSLGPNDYVFRGPNAATDRGSIMTNGSFTSTRSKGPTARASLPLSLQAPLINERRPSADSFVPSLARASSPEPYLGDEGGTGATEVLETPTSAVTPLAASPQRPRTQKSLPTLPAEYNAVPGQHGQYSFLSQPPPPLPSTHPYQMAQANKSTNSVRTKATHHGYGGMDSDTVSVSSGKRVKHKSSKTFKLNFGSLGRNRKSSTSLNGGAHEETERRHAYDAPERSHRDLERQVDVYN